MEVVKQAQPCPKALTKNLGEFLKALVACWFTLFIYFQIKKLKESLRYIIFQTSDERTHAVHN